MDGGLSSVKCRCRWRRSGRSQRERYVTDVDPPPQNQTGFMMGTVKVTAGRRHLKESVALCTSFVLLIFVFTFLQHAGMKNSQLHCGKQDTESSACWQKRCISAGSGRLDEHLKWDKAAVSQQRCIPVAFCSFVCTN